MTQHEMTFSTMNNLTKKSCVKSRENFGEKSFFIVRIKNFFDFVVIVFWVFFIKISTKNIVDNSFFVFNINKTFKN